MKTHPKIMFYHDGRHPHMYRYEPPMSKDEMIAMIEGAFGKRIPFNVLIRIQTVGVILLAIFFFIVLKNDVLSLF